MRSFTHLFMLILLLCNAATTLSQWEWAGGSPAVDFQTVGSAGKYLMASGMYAGDWPVCSTDRGESWITLEGIGPMAFNPVLVTSTNDTFALALGANSSVYRLRDTAQTWVRSDSGLGGAQIRWLAFSHAAALPQTGVAIAVSPTSGVYRSMDLGLHWSPSNSGLTSPTTVTATAIDSTFLVGTTNQGIFRSTNNGLTWEQAANGLPDTGVSVLGSMSGRVFAGSGCNVYQSSNDGGSWALIAKPVPALVLNLILVPTPGRGIGVALFAVTAAGHYRLAAGDSDWVKVKATPLEIYGENLVFSLTAVDTVLYSVDYDRMTRSTDLGKSWRELIYYSDRYSIREYATGHTSSHNDHPRVYLGPFVSTNFGSKWISVHPMNDDRSRISAFSVSQDTSNEGYDKLVLGTESGTVEFSSDGGQTWKILHQHTSLPPMTNVYHPFGVTELDGVVFTSLQYDQYNHYAGDTITGVYRTTIEGTTWEKMNTAGLTDSLVLTLDLIRGKNGGRVLFAGTWFNLFRSTNDGESWTGLDSAQGVRSGRKRLCEVNGTLFLCTEGTAHTEYTNEGDVIQTFDSAGVYRSADDGLTWNQITGNLHATFARGFAAVARQQDPSRVFLAVSRDIMSTLQGAEANIYTSTEGGKQWRPFQGQIQARYDNSSPVGADDRYVYWQELRRPWSEAELTEIGPVQTTHPVEFSLSQNYPNPFNPLTVIKYTIAGAGGRGSGVSKTSLVVYDVLGRQVATLVNELQAPGTYEIRFDGSRLASGVYFYRLTAGSFVQSRKMLLIK